MATFVFTFLFLLAIMLAMALGVILMGKRIKGSCGGLNAVSGADHCLVCKREIDPDSSLRERMECPRARKARDAARTDS